MSVNLNTGKLEKAKDIVKSNLHKHICMDEECCKYKYLPKLKFCCEKKCCVIPNIKVNGEYLIEKKKIQ